jgi:hypothetical protein
VTAKATAAFSIAALALGHLVSGTFYFYHLRKVG